MVGGVGWWGFGGVLGFCGKRVYGRSIEIIEIRIYIVVGYSWSVFRRKIISLIGGGCDPAEEE